MAERDILRLEAVRRRRSAGIKHFAVYRREKLHGKRLLGKLLQRRAGRRPGRQLGARTIVRGKRYGFCQGGAGARRHPAMSDRTDARRGVGTCVVRRLVRQQREIGDVPDIDALWGALDLGDPRERVEDGGAKRCGAIGTGKPSAGGAGRGVVSAAALCRAT